MDVITNYLLEVLRFLLEVEKHFGIPQGVLCCIAFILTLVSIDMFTRLIFKLYNKIFHKKKKVVTVTKSVKQSDNRQNSKDSELSNKEVS